MGAEQFTEYSGIADLDVAFRTAVDEAAWDHGHSGYTGTIAEKSSFVIYTPPEGITAEQAVSSFDAAWDGTITPSWADAGWHQALEYYNDKWGPCVAVRNVLQGGWIFTGYASS